MAISRASRRFENSSTSLGKYVSYNRLEYDCYRWNFEMVSEKKRKKEEKNDLSIRSRGGEASCRPPPTTKTPYIHLRTLNLRKAYITPNCLPPLPLHPGGSCKSPAQPYASKNTTELHDSTSPPPNRRKKKQFPPPFDKVGGNV